MLIPVVLSSDAHYAKFMGVTILSCLLSASRDDELHFYILDGGILAEDRKKLEGMAERFHAKMTFIAMDGDLFSGLKLDIRPDNHHVTIASYYRLFISSLVPEDKCIYLDCDMLVFRSLSGLLGTDLGGSIAAGVPDLGEDSSSERLGLHAYVNAGMLLMDLAAMRDLHIQEAFLDFIRKNPEKLVYHDQDVINSVLDGKIAKLDKRWNVQICKTRKCRETGFHALRKNAFILHFIGHRKPWHRRCKTPERLLYWQYLQKSPWAEAPLAHAWHVLLSFFRI